MGLAAHMVVATTSTAAAAVSSTLISSVMLWQYRCISSSWAWHTSEHKMYCLGEQGRRGGPGGELGHKGRAEGDVH